MLNPHESGSATESSEERCPVYPGISFFHWWNYCFGSRAAICVPSLKGNFPFCFGEEGSLVYALVINAVRAQ